MATKKKSKLKSDSQFKVTKLQAALLTLVVVIFGVTVVGFTRASTGVDNIGCPTPYTNMRVGEGASGKCVRGLQQFLNSVGGAGLAVDGKFGPRTKTATKNFQAFFKIPVTGVIDGKTYWTLIYVNAKNCSEHKPNCFSAATRY